MLPSDNFKRQPCSFSFIVSNNATSIVPYFYLWLSVPPAACSKSDSSLPPDLHLRPIYCNASPISHLCSLSQMIGMRGCEVLLPIFALHNTTYRGLSGPVVFLFRTLVFLCISQCSWRCLSSPPGLGLQGCAKKFLLSSVRFLPFRMVGCALAA